MTIDRSTSREVGDCLILDKAHGQIQSFFDELKNNTRNYRTISSLDGQIAQAYRGRCILELLQNAHDALETTGPDDPKQISFVLRTTPEPVLLVGNSGRPFRSTDFEGICQLGQSPKDPNKSVGNKGLGFRSVLEVSSRPEIWSTAHDGSDISFVFRFDSSVTDQVAEAVREVKRRGPDARSPFDPGRPLVDWSPEQMAQFCSRLQEIDGAGEAREFLSPYLLPLPITDTQSEVERLMGAGHVSVVRLPLDGGRAGTCQEALRSVKDQLQGLDARSMVFLPRLEKLVIDVDGERRILERMGGTEAELPNCRRTRHQQLLVGDSRPVPGESTTRQFQIWTRIIGGDNDPEQAERIRAVVQHLPNQWPKVRQVTVGVAVEENATPQQGVFVIFLPTEMTTGTGAYINAPFYGSLDRRQIDFHDPYNEMLRESVLDLCLDVVAELVSGRAEDRRAQAVLDILSSTAPVGGGDWCFMDALQERALERNSALETQALILCDGGWCIPSEARTMPDVPDTTPIRSEQWRESADFAVVSRALDGRCAAVEALLSQLGGSLSPTDPEWCRTIEQMAESVRTQNTDVTWDAFLNSLVAVLPEHLRSRSINAGSPDPLASVVFLPTRDGRLLSTSDTAKLFFLPVRGIDDAVDFVGEVPDALQQHVAFLHSDVRIQDDDGSRRRNTPVQKFLDGRFVRAFRREDLLRDVALTALPPLPVPHDSPTADLCSDILAWALMLVDTDKLDTLLPLLQLLPVACHGGWFPISDAVFGPGWPDRLGGDVWLLAESLPEDMATQLRKAALLPPNDQRWRTAVVKDRSELFSRLGVVDGLRPRATSEIRFPMRWSSYKLPSIIRSDTPQTAWDEWRSAVHEKARPRFDGKFQYSLSGIQLLPEIHALTKLSPPGKKALSCLILAALRQWPADWQSVRITKCKGAPWSRTIPSPLHHWLRSLPWLIDGDVAERPLSQRWLVPSSLLRVQPDRFQHLSPLSLELARRLEAEPELREALTMLGLNIYPEEDNWIGSELLEALAAAWAEERVPIQRFDVFLGQVRNAWQHLDPGKGLPETFLVRTERRAFSVRRGDELADVYLPDQRDRMRALLEHGKPILEMHPADAGRLAETILAQTTMRRASTLEERFVIDNAQWTGQGDGIPLEETRYAWLPTPLLAIAAHGGANPRGAETEAWRAAADRLRRASVLECIDITAQLVSDGKIVVEKEREAQWLSGDVLAIRHDTGLSYERLAPAAQAILDRQDLLKDLRLVLTALADQENPTPEQIEAALEQAEIDAEPLADIRNRWTGSVSLLVDRLRPVLALFGISSEGLSAAAIDTAHLTAWLSANLSQWPPQAVLAATQQSPDDYAMGLATWRALGDVAQLPMWNAALIKLGDPYVAVENREAREQTAAHLESVIPFLRGLARHIAVETCNPTLFRRLEAATRHFQGEDYWSSQWWEVPLNAVLAALRTNYAAILDKEDHLKVLQDAETLEELRSAFQKQGIAINPDPYEIARRNKERLEQMLSNVHDLHCLWTESIRTPEPPTPPDDLNASAYLDEWSDRDLLEHALRIIGDNEFAEACDGCASPDEIRSRLDLDPENIKARRQERLQRKREAERKQRTFDVAGFSFEVGTTSYGELFGHLAGLAHPEGPRASEDAFTPLADTCPDHTRSGGGGRKTSNQRPSAYLRELVGVVGEMQAFRFLREEFGDDIVTQDAWVSELRLRVFPLVNGEPDNTSDGYGFDFQFNDRGKKWYVEVKATTGDDQQFDLGISEIEAATRFARKRRGRWRILRVRKALSGQPEFDWLPNPFEEGFKKKFRLHRGGMMVSYSVRRNM